MCVILFIRRTNNGDTVMRGVLPQLVLEHTRACASALIDVNWFAEMPSFNESLSRHFWRAPKPRVCYFVKEAWGPEPDLCHFFGAYSIFDVIDNDRRSGVFPGSHLFPQQVRT